MRLPLTFPVRGYYNQSTLWNAKGGKALTSNSAARFPGCRALSVALIAAASIIGGCSEPPSAEAEIRKTIARAEAGAESRDLGDLRPLIADEYLDERGYDKRQIEQVLRLLFVANQSIHLAVYIESIDIPNPGSATVIALVGMANTADRLPDVDLYQFEVRMVKHDDKEWQVVDADWQRGLGKPPG